MDFGEFYPQWRDTVLWDKWKDYARKCFITGGLCFPQSSTLSLIDSSDDQTADKDRSKTIKTPIVIAIEADGEPVLPSITLDDSYQAKVVQAALRDYCNAHISE
jgi:hypothetical protein